VFKKMNCKFCGAEVAKPGRTFCGYSCSAKFRETNKTPEMKKQLAEQHSKDMEEYYSDERNRFDMVFRMAKWNWEHPEAGQEHSRVMKEKYVSGKYKNNPGKFIKGHKVNLGKSVKLGTKRPYCYTEEGKHSHKLGARKKVEEQRKNGYFETEPAKAGAKAMKEFHKQHPEVRSLCGKKAMEKLHKCIETDIEKRMRLALERIGIKYIAQATIKIPETRKWYFVDFILPERKIIIECDGEQWHKEKEKEAEREYAILTQPEYSDFVMARFTGKEINNDIDFCLNTIKQIHN
jgi:very-short-patch-repair endonuclease